jgi:hypothetical protein
MYDVVRLRGGGAQGVINEICITHTHNWWYFNSDVLACAVVSVMGCVEFHSEVSLMAVMADSSLDVMTRLAGRGAAVFANVCVYGPVSGVASVHGVNETARTPCHCLTLSQ